MEHYQQQMIDKATAIGYCGGSDTMRYISTVCDELRDKCSRLDDDNKLLASLALIEAIGGSKRVLSAIQALAKLAPFEDENGVWCEVATRNGVTMWEGTSI